MFTAIGLRMTQRCALTDTLIGISLACSIAAYRHDPFPIHTGYVTMVTVIFLAGSLMVLAAYIPANRFRCEFDCHEGNEAGIPGLAQEPWGTVAVHCG